MRDALGLVALCDILRYIPKIDFLAHALAWAYSLVATVQTEMRGLVVAYEFIKEILVLKEITMIVCNWLGVFLDPSVVFGVLVLGTVCDGRLSRSLLMSGCAGLLSTGPANS